MKRYLISTVVVIAILVVAWTAFGQEQEKAGQRQSMRQRIRNMSEEERAEFMERMRTIGLVRPPMTITDQKEAIKVIEEQLDKFKAAVQVQAEARSQGAPRQFRELSQEERSKLVQNFRDRRTALGTIVEQIALIQGQRRPEEEGARFIIINTAHLRPIQEMAEKEMAQETSELLALIADAPFDRGPFLGGGRRGQGGQRRP